MRPHSLARISSLEKGRTFVMTICFCGALTQESSYSDQFLGRPLRLCMSCGTLSIEQAPSPAELETFYANAYSESRSDFIGEAYLAVMRHRATAQVGFIGRHMALGGKRVLDHGCGYGVLLDALRGAGMTTAGFDHDPRCREALRERGHELATADPLEHDRRWDLICFSHVIEHLPEPATLLGALRDKADRLFIELPRYDARRSEAFADQEGHLWFFTPAGARALVESAGWHILEATAAGPSLNLYWREGTLPRIGRRLRRAVSKDWFFGQYDRQAADGMWIRIIAERMQ
jgi:SAM-dependent methyltransferase